MKARVLKFDDAAIPPELQVPTLIPAARTILKYNCHKLGTQYQRGVLTLWFDAIEYDGVAVPKYYNVVLTEPNRFVVPRGADLVTDFRRVFSQPVGRLDRFPLSWLKGKMFVGDLRVVKTDARKKQRDSGTHYSVVDKLIKIYEV